VRVGPPGLVEELADHHQQILPVVDPAAGLAKREPMAGCRERRAVVWHEPAGANPLEESHGSSRPSDVADFVSPEPPVGLSVLDIL